jgi:hypothetical protein
MHRHREKADSFGSAPPTGPVPCFQRVSRGRSGGLDSGVAITAPEAYLRLLALLARRAIHDIFYCPDILSQSERYKLERNEEATFLLSAVNNPQFVLDELLHRVRVEHKKSLVDLMGDVIMHALSYVPMFRKSSREVLLLLEVEDAHRLASRDSQSGSNEANLELLAAVRRLVSDERRRPLWQRWSAGNQRLRLVVTAQHLDGRSVRRGTGHPDDPVITVGMFAPGDYRDFLSNSRLRELLGEETTEALLSPEIWRLTNGHPWFLSRLIRAVAYLRNNTETCGDQWDISRILHALAEGTRLWLFDLPFEAPELLLEETRSYPDVPSQESALFSAVVNCIEENPAVLEWFRGVTSRDGNGLGLYPFVGRPVEETETLALPLVRLGVLQFDRATDQYSFSNELVRRHFSASRLEAYIGIRELGPHRDRGASRSGGAN